MTASSTDAALTAIAERLSTTAAEYAAKLLEAGFTVYLPASRTVIDGSLGPERVSVRLQGWFHYSHEVPVLDPAPHYQTCYGTFDDGSDKGLFSPPEHRMPIASSQLNGSSAYVRVADELPALSVAAANLVARPSNWCPFNAEPTPEALRRAVSGAGVPQKFYRGALLRNARPRGIAEGRYVDARKFMIAEPEPEAPESFEVPARLAADAAAALESRGVPKLARKVLREIVAYGAHNGVNA